MCVYKLCVLPFKNVIILCLYYLYRMDMLLQYDWKIYDNL